MIASADEPWRFFYTVCRDAQSARIGVRKTVWDLDVYAWLVHRLFTLTRPSSMSWVQLSGQFGHNYGAIRYFRRFFGESVQRLEGAVARFEAALLTFAASTREFREFNLHLKDNVQRLSLSFGDFSETLRSEIGALKSGDGR